MTIFVLSLQGLRDRLRWMFSKLPEVDIRQNRNTKLLRQQTIGLPSKWGVKNNRKTCGTMYGFELIVPDCG